MDRIAWIATSQFLLVHVMAHETAVSPRVFQHTSAKVSNSLQSPKGQRSTRNVGRRTNNIRFGWKKAAVERSHIGDGLI